MPVALTYPGVYVEEIPSGVRTITGVATSITAFLGRALQGPTDEPITINSFGDFERQFGGLHVDYPMSYAVRDFYLNGGSQAIIVRLYNSTSPSNVPDAEPHQNAGKSKITIDNLEVLAKSSGKWGDKLSATIDVKVSDEVKEQLGLRKEDVLFNLTVYLGKASEKFLNLTLTDNARRIDRVLKAESNWVELEWPENIPDMTNTKAKIKALAEAKQGLVEAKKSLAEAEVASPQVPDNITKEKEKLTAANEALKKANEGVVTATKTIGGADGEKLVPKNYQGSEADKTGMYALEKADLFNLLCIPPDSREEGKNRTPDEVYQRAMGYCTKRRAMLIVDSPPEWGKKKETAAQTARDGLSGLGLTGTDARNAALYFPRVVQKDPLREGQLDTFVPCGIIAGRMAYTDATRGVWKAPAGLDASLNGIQGLQVNLTDDENGMLNPLGINCLRSFPVNGRVIWGARTLRGADQLADEWKYIPVRRTALFIEESLYRGTQWVVFEPNDEPLWSQIRLNVGSFMHNLFRQGAFQGSSPREAYFVKCDKETTPQNDIDRGIVNIVVGFAPLKPAEFVVIKLQQIVGELEV